MASLSNKKVNVIINNACNNEACLVIQLHSKWDGEVEKNRNGGWGGFIKVI